MSTNSDESPSAIKNMLDELNGMLECEELPSQINEQLERGILNLTSINKLPVDPKRFLANIKRILVDPKANARLDYDLMLEMLSKIVATSSFEDVLTVFSVEDLVLSLKSGNPSLIKAANQVIARSYPKGLFANSEILDILLDLYFDSSYDISVINSIEHSISNLSSDELVRRRILINNLPPLMVVRKKFEPTSMARLLEILNLLCRNMEHSEFIEKLFVVRGDELIKSLDIDVVLFIHIVVYYTNLLNEVDVIEVGGHTHEWLLRYIQPIVPALGDIYAQNDKYPDVKYFARSYLFKFFQKLSYLDDESLFRFLDENYIHISPETRYLTDFLSFVNPSYLSRYYSTLLTRFATVTPSKLGVIRNLVAHQQSFALIKSHITADAILAMPYMEQMVLLQRVSQYPHSAEYLLNDLPKVMSNLISNGNGEVIESETVALRRETIENLLKYDQSVWHIPLMDEMIKITGGRPRSQVQTSLASSYI